MLRRIAFGAGAAMAAIGIAVSVPGAAMAAPSTDTAPSASATAGDVDAKGRIPIIVASYEKTLVGKALCVQHAKLWEKDMGDPAQCQTSVKYYDVVAWWQV